MEKYSAAYAAETTSDINFWSQGANICILLSEGLSHFAFQRLSEKQKKTKALRSLRLCGE